MKTISTKITSLLIIAIFLCSFKGSNESTTLGFYVNNGKTAVTELSCYDFDNLCIKHEVTREMLGYDKIHYTISYSSSELSSHEYEMQGQIFQSKYKSGDIATISVFKDDLKESSQFRSSTDGYNTRSEWQYTDRNAVKEITASITINGAVIKGYEEKYDAGSSSYKRVPMYEWTKLDEKKDALVIKNRIKNKNRVFQFIPGLNFFLGSKPKNIVKTGTCLSK